jgi:hypothetical protein
MMAEQRVQRAQPTRNWMQRRRRKKYISRSFFSSSFFFQLFLFFFFQKNCISVSLNSGPASLLFALSIRQTCGRAHGTAVRCIPARK